MAPNAPDALLTRAQAADELAKEGYPTKKATLSTLASRGGGPSFRHYGARVLYRREDLLTWARSKLSPLVASTAELHVLAAPESTGKKRDYEPKPETHTPARVASRRRRKRAAAVVNAADAPATGPPE
jgi:hypothetical protein